MTDAVNLESVQFGEEEVEQHRSHDGTETGTGPQSDTLPQCDSEITHRQAEGQTTYTPQYSEENSHPNVKGIGGSKQFEQTVSRRNGQQSTQERQHQPRE